MAEKDIGEINNKMQESLDKIFTDSQGAFENGMEGLVGTVNPEETANRKPLPSIEIKRKSNIDGNIQDLSENNKESKTQPDKKKKTYSDRRTTNIFSQVFAKFKEYAGKMSEEEMFLKDLENEKNNIQEIGSNENNIKTDEDFENLLNRF